MIFVAHVDASEIRVCAFLAEPSKKSANAERRVYGMVIHRRDLSKATILVVCTWILVAPAWNFNLGVCAILRITRRYIIYECFKNRLLLLHLLIYTDWAGRSWRGKE